MKRTLIHTAVFTLLAGAFAFAPAALQAQETSKTNAPAAPKPPKPEALRFIGKVSAIDKTAKTITLGANTYEITSQSRIFKGGSPATLEDYTVGDIVSGTYKAVGDKRHVVRMTIRKEAAAPGSAPTDTPK